MHRFILVSLLVLNMGAAKDLNAQTGFLREFALKWQNAAQYTLETAEAMPAELFDFRPTAEEMTFGDQLLHIASNMVWLSGTYLGGGEFHKDLKQKNLPKAEVIFLLMEAFDYAGQAVAAFPESEMETQVEFFAGPMSKRQIITLMNDHSTHHRGQLVVYLRLNGIKPPRYRGW